MTHRFTLLRPRDMSGCWDGETSNAMYDTLTIDVISDVVCPWCFIGKRRLERALAQRPELRVETRWRPFQLDATIPPEGKDRQAYLAAKFGPERIDGLHATIRAAGAVEGIAFAFEKITRSPNTRDAHRVIRWAASAGRQNEVVERLFTAYFLEGADLGDHSVLVAQATAAGMDGAIVRKLLDEGADLELIDQEIAHAQRMGVTGVPCFIFAGRYAVMGAERTEALLATIDRALADRDDEVLAESHPVA